MGVEVKADSLSGHPAKSIMSYAEKNDFDLIVLGNRGHSELWGRFLGHTADKISENAHCSVLIVRR
ncbi:MAG TPA: universal stress protein [Bacteroidota bacterium]|nr:universal stress protein [Bacteroidota bacterium]